MNNVLYIESGTSGGGSFESLFQLIQSLDKKRYTPFVVFLNKTKYLEKLDEIGINTYTVKDFLYTKKRTTISKILDWFAERVLLVTQMSFPALSVFIDRLVHLRTIQFINELSIKQSIDIIHTNNQINRDLYAIIGASKSAIPCVSHLRSFHSLGFNKYKADYGNKAVNIFIAYSRSIAEHWIRAGIHRGKIAVVHNAIGDFDVTPMNLYSNFGIPKKRKIIGAVGRIIPERGYGFLLNGFYSLFKRIQDVHLLIIGDGSEKNIQKLKKMISNLSLVKHVTFTGRLSEAKNAISALDVLTLPYSIEPFGRVLLEAWKLQTPIILSDIGYIRDIVADQKDGLIVPYGDAESMACALQNILINARLRNAIIAGGLEKCRREFSISAHALKIEKLYESILNKN